MILRKYRQHPTKSIIYFGCMVVGLLLLIMALNLNFKSGISIMIGLAAFVIFVSINRYGGPVNTRYEIALRKLLGAGFLTIAVNAVIGSLLASLITLALTLVAIDALSSIFSQVDLSTLDFLMAFSCMLIAVLSPHVLYIFRSEIIRFIR